MIVLGLSKFNKEYNVESGSFNVTVEYVHIDDCGIETLLRFPTLKTIIGFNLLTEGTMEKLVTEYKPLI